jgi:hypothetical protein
LKASLNIIANLTSLAYQNIVKIVDIKEFVLLIIFKILSENSKSYFHLLFLFFIFYFFVEQQIFFLNELDFIISKI